MGTLSTFQGEKSESIVAAGAALLAPESQINMALVRGIKPAIPALVPNAEGLGEMSAEDLIDLFYDLIPDLKKLDTLVKNWWDENPVEGYSLDSPRLKGAWVRDSGILSHFDFSGDKIRPEYVEGPLTLSWRLDARPKIPRTFSALRYSDIFTLDPDGYDQSFLESEDELKLQAKTTHRQSVTQARQRPYDLAMFANHPAATVHSAQAGQGAHAMLATYHLQKI